MNALLLTALIASTPAEGSVQVRRFALLAAAHDGGGGRELLRYPERDARAFARVLRELGGVHPDDELLVIDPDRAALDVAFEQLRTRVQAARGAYARLEVILYYSGHSDPKGLLLGEERYHYPDLRSRLDELGADVRIAILDSCSSGAMTRSKGGVRRPPFMVDASSRVTGSAVLTSSSEDEAAQESDRLGASFFTHFLVSGLRGAGDTSGDGKVTLDEAYDFAFRGTLARTEATSAGPQHPAYDIQLSGSGDVVMTDLRSTEATLRLPPELDGQVLLRGENGELAVELSKQPGRAVDLGLSAGTYAVSVRRGNRAWSGEVSLEAGEATTLEAGEFGEARLEATRSRGGEGEAPRDILLDIGIAPMLSTAGFGPPARVHVGLSLGLGYSAQLAGLGLSVGATWVDDSMDGLQAGVAFAHAGGDATGVQLGVGASNVVGSMLGFQSGVGAALTGGRMTGLQTSVGLAYAGEVRGLQSSVGLAVAGKVMGLQAATGVAYADEVHGLQASLIGIAGGPASAQLGLVNVAESAGLQLGLVNFVKRTDGVSLGLLQYAAEDGILDFEVTSTDVAFAQAAFQIGTRNIYTSFFAGAGSVGHSEALSYGLALGYRHLFDADWDLGIELASRWVDLERDINELDQIATLELALGYRLAPGILVYAGPALHVLVDLNDAGPERAALAPSFAARPGDDRVYIWPGWALGIRLL